MFHDYYGEKGIREICHAVKQAENKRLRAEAVHIIADDLASCVRPCDILIPAPNHSGQAEYTFRIAEEIAAKVGCVVFNNIICVPHEPLYNNREQLLSFSLTMPINHFPKGCRLFFVDNVISSGKTFLTAKSLLPSLLPLVFAVDCSDGHIGEIRNRYQNGGESPCLQAWR